MSEQSTDNYEMEMPRQSLERSALAALVQTRLPGAAMIWPDGWYPAAPFADGGTHLCLGSLGGIRGHVRTNGDGSFTAFHGDLQLGTVKDLDKAKAAVETGKRIRERGESRKRKAAKDAQPKTAATVAAAPPMGADTGVNGIPPLLPLPVLPLPPLAAPGTLLVPPPPLIADGPFTDAYAGIVTGAEPNGAPLPPLPFPAQLPNLGAAPGTPMFPASFTEPLPAEAKPLPALPTETAATKPKADDIIALETLRGFMPTDWCDQLEQVAVEGFQLKEDELQYKVGYRGSNHKDVPKYYDGPPSIGVEPVITDLLKQAGLDKVRVPGGLIMLVPGVSEARLSRERLLLAGVTVEILDACTDPGTPYTSVTFKRDRR